MVNGCFSNRKRIIFFAGILVCLIMLFSCKKSEDDSIPVLKLGDYYSLEWLTYFESNEFITKQPFLEVDNLNRIFLCYKSDAGLKALTIDSLGNSSELAINGNYTEYFQSVFFSQQNIPYFCTNKRIIKYKDSGSTSYYPVDSGNTHLIMAGMNPTDGSLWVATNEGLYSSQNETDFTLIISHQEILGERYSENPDQNWDEYIKIKWHKNTLYYLIWGQLWTYQDGKWFWINDTFKITDIYISDFCFDSHDMIWATVVGYMGLMKINGVNQVYFPSPPINNPFAGISDPGYNTGSYLSVTNLEIDHNDHIWMSLSYGGLIMFSENCWYTLSPGLEGINYLSLSKPLFISIDNKDNVILGHTEYLTVGRITKK